MIYFVMRCRAYCAAVKDARGEYGKYLLSRTSSKKIQESVFIRCIAKEYNDKCRKKSIKASVQAQYSQILQLYEELKDKMSIIDLEIDHLQAQIRKNSSKAVLYQKEKEKLYGYRKTVYKTGTVTLDMGVTNVGELNSRISDVENTIKEIESDNDRLNSEIDKKEKERVKVIETNSRDLKELIIIYKSDIERIYLVIEYIESQYDKVLQYYGYILTKKLKMAENNNPMKSLMEVCVLCDISVVDKNNLFREECEMINTKIKDLIHLDIAIDEKIHPKKGEKNGRADKSSP